jgi:hypothetical protein
VAPPRRPAQIGVHGNTLARWQARGISPDHEAVPRIAAALRAMPDWRRSPSFIARSTRSTKRGLC